MIFHMDVLKECLPTWVHLRVLETLMQNPGVMSQRQLARVMGIPRATAHRALNDLGWTGLLKPHQVGSVTHWEVDKQGYLYETLRPILEGLGIVVPPLPYLRNLIRKTVKFPKGCRGLVFGSTVQGNDEPSSDIDISVVLPNSLKTPPSSLENDLDRLRDSCREKFGKRLAVIFVHERDLQKQDKELYQNIRKGIEV